MKGFKRITKFLPEIYLLLSVAYYWTLTASKFNPIAITLIIILLFQIIVRGKVLGLIISTIFILLNGYMILALISELSEFSEFNLEAQKLALYGFTYLGVNIIVGYIMLYLYFKKESKKSNIIGEVN